MASLLGRLDQGWNNLPDMKARLREQPSLIAKRFFYDSNVYDPQFLRYLATEMAPERVCVGTDYPYLIMQRDPKAYLASCNLNPDTERNVIRDAALRFFGELE